MIYCQLKDILEGLPKDKSDSYRAHARNVDVGWQQFWMLLHNGTGRVSLKNLQQIRDYLALCTNQVTPGSMRFCLDDRMKERGLTQMQVSEGAGVSYVSVNRIVNNMMKFVDFSVTDRLYVYLELTSLEELLDTGGLLIWREDE